ncbi:MAG TPA: c-type cytochrome, partial [Candidatus Krumholzibacteria bacterium]|nr:c-type cytochrome [Candidatus Krumholzibacteria bacterium]
MPRLLAVVMVFAAAWIAVPAPAQIPDTFTNLKVLPKDIQKAELVGIMRGFSMALNVRCTHCHKGDN